MARSRAARPDPGAGERAGDGFPEHHTFQPLHVTLRLLGFRDEVRQVPYAWSRRNVLPSIPVALGAPGILLCAKLSTDLHVVLEPVEATARPYP